LAGFTPEQLFTGGYLGVAAQKQRVLGLRFTQNPERFVAGPPQVTLPPSRVFINPVSPQDIEAGATDLVNFPTLPKVAQAQAKYDLSSN